MWFILTAVVIATAIHYFMNFITHWRNLGVPQGSIKNVLLQMYNFAMKKISMTESVVMNYNMFPTTRYSGIYHVSKPVLMIRDPDLIKELTVKSFDHFTDHLLMIPETVEPLWARNLFSLRGQKWRNMRSILSPSFTSSKMRTMFILISECAANFSEHYLKKHEDIIEVELKDSFTRFTNDVIATAAFGLKTDSLENPNNQFYLMAKKFMSFSIGIWNGLKFIILLISPSLFKLLKISIFDKQSTSFFIELINDTVKTRKEKGIVRPDMIHLLMEAQKETEYKENQNVIDSGFAVQKEADLGEGVQEELTNVDIAAQALIFFLAGFESVSTLMCFMAFELATNPDIQKRLREEIQETSDDCQGNLTYEALLKMKYMDMVVSESLRKWPNAIVTDRECTKPYTIEPKLPGERPIHMKQKWLIWIPIFGIHRDPNIYPEPERFDPERFNDENKGKIDPYTYLPFGLGPRNCIGSRFALLEIKTVFFYLLQNFEIVPISKSPIPLRLSRSSFHLIAEGGFWFGLKKLSK